MNDIYIPPPKITQPAAANREPIDCADVIAEELRAAIRGTLYGVYHCQNEWEASYTDWQECDDVELELVDGYDDDLPETFQFECDGEGQDEETLTGVVTCTLAYYGKKTRNVGEDQQIVTLVARYEIEVT